MHVDSHIHFQFDDDDTNNHNHSNNNFLVSSILCQGLRLLTPWFLQYTSLALKSCYIIYSMVFNQLVSITVFLSYTLCIHFFVLTCH